MLLIALGLFIQSVQASTMVSKVVSVLDGDTIIVVVAGSQQQRIRFAGIDAPESKQTFGIES